MPKRDDEVSALYDVAERFRLELERIATLPDVEAGRALKRLLRSSSPVLPVPNVPARKARTRSRRK